MPRFFFDFQGDGQEVHDENGMDLRGSEDARAEAVRMLPVSRADLPIGDNEFRTWRVSVRDENGRIVVRLIMALLVEVPGDGESRVFSPG